MESSHDPASASHCRSCHYWTLVQYPLHSPLEVARVYEDILSAQGMDIGPGVCPVCIAVQGPGRDWRIFPLEHNKSMNIIHCTLDTGLSSIFTDYCRAYLDNRRCNGGINNVNFEQIIWPPTPQVGLPTQPGSSLDWIYTMARVTTNTLNVPCKDMSGTCDVHPDVHCH